MYDLSKKYHHGADEGSTLGLSWINPDELELFDSELKEIFEWIDENYPFSIVTTTSRRIHHFDLIDSSATDFLFVIHLFVVVKELYFQLVHAYGPPPNYFHLLYLQVLF